MKTWCDKYEHHLLLKMAGDGIEEAQRWLTEYFQQAEGDFFACTPEEGSKAFLHRFAAAGAAIRCTLHSAGKAGIRLLGTADGAAFKTEVVPLVPGDNLCRIALDRKGAVKFEGIELVSDGSGVDLTLHNAALLAETAPALS